MTKDPALKAGTQRKDFYASGNSLSLNEEASS